MGNKQIIMWEGNQLGLAGQYETHELCDLIHLEGAKALPEYKDDFYSSSLWVNGFKNIEKLDGS